MGEPQEFQLGKMEGNGAKQTKSLEENNFPYQMNQSFIMSREKRYYRYLRLALYTALVLMGLSGATLMGRLYYERGGKSKWMGTLMQIAGFPILLTYYYFISQPKNLTTKDSSHENQTSVVVLVFVYVFLGLLLALDCYLYALGLCYLPVSTYALIVSSQLTFNALFSYFFTSLKFTPFIINSLVLLTISSTLLVFQNDSSTQDSNKNFVIGFICTVVASAAYGLMLCLTQVAFRKVIKKENFKVVLDMIIYQSLVATVASLVGLFVSGEWSGLKKEMEGYELGKASYVMTLIFTSILSQVFIVGSVGMIFEVSALFSNAINILGLPIVHIVAVMFFQDRMGAIKAISMVLAIWGFMSYAYQQYLDECQSQIEENRSTHHFDKAWSHLEEGTRGIS